MVAITDFILSGNNPYSLGNQPVYANMYGILYHLVTYPFSALFGSGLVVHRIVTAFCIWGTCHVFYSVTRHYKVPILLGVGTTLVLYKYLLEGTTPYARPDSLGMFLFLASIYIPLKQNFSRSSLTVSIVLGILALLTKPYFALSVPFLISYLFLFRSKKTAFGYGIASCASISATLLIVSHFLETYITNIFFVSLNFGSGTIRRSFQQLGILFKQDFFLLLIPCIYFGCLVCRACCKSYRLDLKKALINVKSSFNILGFIKSFTNFNMDIVTFGVIFFTPVFCITLGRHDGNYMVYIYHLILPFVYLVILKVINSQNRSLFVGGSYFLIIAHLFLISRPGMLPFPAYPERQWRQLEELLLQHQNVCNSPAIVSILVGQGKQIADSGLSDVYWSGLHRRGIWGALFPTPKKFAEGYEGFLQNTRESIASKKYGLMVLTKGQFFPSWFVSRELVEAHYDYRETLPAPMPSGNWEVEIWKPKTAEALMKIRGGGPPSILTSEGGIP